MVQPDGGLIVKIEVCSDTSRREIRFEVTEGQAPDLDVTKEWHRSPRFIRPDKGYLVIVDGEVRRIAVAGGLVKKSGEPSDSIRDKREWRPTSGAYTLKERIEEAPDWVQEIWAQAASGVTGWTFARTGPEGEV